MELAHADFDQLYGQLFRYSKVFVEKQDGQFLPRGAVLSWDGKPGVVGGLTKEEQPGAPVTLELLINGLRKMAASGKFRAAGLAVDSLLKTQPRKDHAGKDAIAIALGHKDGMCQAGYPPYVKSQTGSYTIYKPFVIPRKPHLFSKQI